MKRLIVALALLLPMPTSAKIYTLKANAIMAHPDAKFVHSHTDEDGNSVHTVILGDVAYYCVQKLRVGFNQFCYTQIEE